MTPPPASSSSAPPRSSASAPQTTWSAQCSTCSSGATTSPEPPLSSTAAAPSAEPALLRDVVIVGGGCYGTFYATQLERARARGAAAYRRLLLIDRDPSSRAARELPPDAARELVVQDWGAFFDEFLASPERGAPPAEPRDAIVPSPLMPHLMY